MPPKAAPKKSAAKAKQTKTVAILYSLEGCPYCTDAKRELRKKGYPVKEHKISHDGVPHMLPDGRTNYNYPQVFMITVVGGLSEVEKLPASKKKPAAKKK